MIVCGRILNMGYFFLVGDNFDIYVKILKFILEKRNKDFYLFILNVIFSWIVIIDMLNIKLNVEVNKFIVDDVLLILGSLK